MKFATVGVWLRTEGDACAGICVCDVSTNGCARAWLPLVGLDQALALIPYDPLSNLNSLLMKLHTPRILHVLYTLAECHSLLVA